MSMREESPDAEDLKISPHNISDIPLPDAEKSEHVVEERVLEEREAQEHVVEERVVVEHVVNYQPEKSAFDLDSEEEEPKIIKSVPIANFELALN